MSKGRSAEAFQLMKINYKWTFYVVILGILVWGFINSNGIRGAWANNLWSTTFVKSYFEDQTPQSPVSSPPATHAQSSIFLVKQALKQKDYDKALEYITPLVDTRDPVVLEIYAQVLYQQGKYTPAFEVWESMGDEASLWRAAGEMREIGREDLRLSTAKSLYIINPELHVSFYAGSFREANDDAQAILLLNDAINKYPQSENIQQWNKMLSDAYAAQGKYYQDQKQYDKAEELFLRAINAREENWIAWKYLGYIYYDRDKDPERAIECFLKVIELAPETSEGYGDIANVYGRENNVPAALEWYEKAMAQFPDKQRFFMGYANLLRDSNQLNKAIDAYNTVVNRFPGEAWAYYEMAIAYSRNEQPEEAIKAIEQAISLNYDISAYHTLAGQVYEQGGYPDKALEAYKNALVIDPGNGWAKDAVERLAGSN